jgi:glucose/arabinose dehydrogenase
MKHAATFARFSPALVFLFTLMATARAGTTPLTSVRVASGLARPVFVTAPPGDTSRVFIVEQRSGTVGRIRVLQIPSNVLLPTAFLSISPLATGNEEGLLGLAFHPNYRDNGYFWVYYTNTSGNNVVVRYQANAPFDTSNTANAASATAVLTFAHPTNTNHNGGWMAFGPDGYLYIATGDGGSANDPPNNAQNINSLLGKMHRLDVDGADNIPGNADDDGFPADATRLYSTPADNPFAGATPGLDEIWSIGLRNPWRSGFDRLTGDLYTGDVGQNAVEEVDFQPGGMAPTPVRNYGWRCMEGTSCTGLTGCTCNAPDLTLPIHTFTHAAGNCSVTGGYVYRGCAMPAMHGIYFFADYCSAQIWSFRYSTGTGVTEFTNRTAELAPGGGLSIATITSFGEDAVGELYICDQAGEVFKIIPAGATNPIGACCTAGDCSQLSAADCAAQGGQYLGDCLLCENLECPEACCFVAGDCSDIGPTECLDRGGTSAGPDTSCATFECIVPPEACCLPGGSCIDATPEDCRPQGGSSGGFGSACLGDNNGNGLDDFCEPPVSAATVLSAVSRKSNPNGSTGGFCDTPTHPVVGSEPHMGGVSELRITFDGPPGMPGSAQVLTNLEESTCASPPYVPYTGSSAVTPSIAGNTLVLNFSLGLENARRYRFSVPPSVTTITGQTVEVRSLLGDVNGNGVTDAIDRSLVVGAWTGGGFTCPTDLDSSGQTNASDRSIVIGAWTGPQACAP